MPPSIRPSASPWDSATPWDIDPDIRRAQTPPAEFYHRELWYRQSIDRIFARGWHYLGDTPLTPAPNTAHPTLFMPDSLDEPVAVIRDATDNIRCLSNVCTHRGNLVVTESGPITRLRCGYHGRRFEFDGRFRSMPEFQEVENFPCPADDLRALPLGRWGPLLLASLESDPSFEAWWSPVREVIGAEPKRELRFSEERSRDYEVDANWALYVENYLEGFHIPFVHETLHDTIDFSTYRTETFDGGVLQWTEAADGEPAFSSDDVAWTQRPGVDGRRVGALYLWLYPSLMLNFYPWGLSLNSVEPIGPTRTRVRFRSYVSDVDQLDRGAGGDVDHVEHEDEAIVEQVQVGVKSRIYSRGRYSPTQERGTHHFHRLIAQSLFDAPVV